MSLCVMVVRKKKQTPHYDIFLCTHSTWRFHFILIFAPSLFFCFACFILQSRPFSTIKVEQMCIHVWLSKRVRNQVTWSVFQGLSFFPNRRWKIAFRCFPYHKNMILILLWPLFVLQFYVFYLSFFVSTQRILLLLEVYRLTNGMK